MRTGQQYRRFSGRAGRRRALGVLGVGGAAFGLAIAGCGGEEDKETTSAGSSPSSGTAAASPNQGGSLTTYLSSPSSEQLEPQALRSNSANTQPYLALIYNTLLRYKLGEQVATTDRTLEGALATKWEQPDPTTLTFQLRPRVKFHNKPPVNGRELVAEDVKFTFERLLASQFSYLRFYDTIDTVQSPSDETVIFKLKSPNAAILTHLAVGYTWIIAKEAGRPDSQGVQGTTYKDVESAIGTGPFMADSYEHGVRFTANRNPDYFEQGLPYLDRVEYQVIQDDSTILAALAAGRLQVGAVPSGSAGDLRATSRNLVYTEDYSFNYYATDMRTDKPPFSDLRVRRAMAMAWDQKAIASLLETPDAPLTYGSVPAAMGDAYLPADKLGENAKWWQVNLQEAKQLLTAAGHGDGFTADYNASLGNQPTDYPEVFAADMAKIGITVPVKLQEHAAFQSTTLIGEYEGLAGAVLFLFDPGDFFVTLLPGSQRNLSHVNDPRLNELVARQQAELDTAKRLEIIHELVRHLAGQVYVIPKPQIITTYAQQPSVKNFKPRFGYQPVFTATWLDK